MIESGIKNIKLTTLLDDIVYVSATLWEPTPITELCHQNCNHIITFHTPMCIKLER